MNNLDYAWSNRAGITASNTAYWARSTLIAMEGGGHLWPDALMYIDRAIKELTEARAIHEQRMAEQKDAA